MTFTGLLFILWFLPVSLVLYYIVNDKARPYVLLSFCAFFYLMISSKYFIVLAGLSFIVTLVGRFISGCRNRKYRALAMIGGTGLSLAVLALYKYVPVLFPWCLESKLFETNIQNQYIFPIGISFFTFKAISYLADIYSDKAKLKEEYVYDLLYLTFFAQLQAGPLARYNDMLHGAEQANKVGANLKTGSYRFVVGFIKKVLLADTLALIANEVYKGDPTGLSSSYAWLGSICYSLQLYYDFSGYSDMAIGLTRMFGYGCPENFKYPYTTNSISDFWRRWHVTLGEWFRDYIYIPLGGSRNAEKYRVYINLFIVWLLTGIWHGSQVHFIAWGLIYFVLIACEKMFKIPQRITGKSGRMVYRMIVLFAINMQWVIFRAPSLKSALFVLKRMVVFKADEMYDARTLFLIKDNAVFLITALIMCFPVAVWMENKCKENRITNVIYQCVFAGIISFGFVWAVSFVVCGQNNPFAYANF